MAKNEGAGRKLSAEWTMVNKIENKFQVICKICNDIIIAKIVGKRVHISKYAKREANLSSNTVYNDEISNEIELLRTQKRKLLVEDSMIFL